MCVCMYIYIYRERERKRERERERYARAYDERAWALCKDFLCFNTMP